MGQRRVRKMLRKMACGRPVEVTVRAASLQPFAHMAAVAEQFGYAYVDVRRRPGRGNGWCMSFVPDPDPQVRQRAEQNRAQYPDATTRGALPPVPVDVLDVFKARISYDLEDGHTDKERTKFLYAALTVVCAVIGVLVALGTSRTTAAIVAAAAWVVLMSVTWPLVSVRRRKRARFAAILETAGFTETVQSSGRSRYLPQRDRLSSPSTPFLQEP